MKRKHLSTVFKILSTLLILFFLFREISFNEKDFLQTWKQLDLLWLLLVLPFVIIVLAIKSYRWKLLLSAEGYSYNYISSLKAYLASYSIGVVTPGRLGELIKVYNARNEIEKLDGVTAFKTVLLDRLFDLFFLSWFGLAGLLFYFRILGEINVWLILLISLVAGFLTLWLIHLSFRGIFRKKIQNNKALLFINDCLSGLLSPKNLSAWFISLIAYLVFFTGIQFLFFSVDIHINLLETAFIISLIGLILLLPISIAGFGTREAGLVYLLSFYGISAETAIGFSLLQFLTFFVWGGLVGLFFWMAQPVSLSLIKEDSKKIWQRIRAKY